MSLGEQVLPPSDRTEMPDPADLMIDDAEDLENVATQSINITGDVIARATELLPETQKQLLRWLYSWAMDNHFTWQILQDRVGLHKSTLYRIFNGKYLYPQRRKVGGVMERHPKAGLPIALDGLCKKIAALKAREEKVKSLFSVGFLQTSVWQQIECACRHAASKNKPVFVYGDGQIGKTAAAEEYAHKHNHGVTTYIRIPPTGGTRGLMVAFAQALHLNWRTPFEVMRSNVIEALDKSKLLILDEMHEIFITSSEKTAMRLLEEIRYIWDRTHCGMVLIGTNVFRDAFKEAQFRQFLGQLRRRGLYEVNLPPITPKEDMDMAIASYGLEWPDENSSAASDLVSLARDGFGQLLTALETGRGVAEKAGHAYTWDDFVTAQNVVRKMAMGVK